MPKEIIDTTNVVNSMIVDLLEKIEMEEIQPDNDVRKITRQEYEFTVDKLLYKVELVESREIAKNKTILEIKFKLLNNPKLPDRNNYKSDIQYDIAVKKSQIGITGTGNSRKVFSKVFYSIISAVKEMNPNYITFTAEESNRQKLYIRFVKVIQKYITKTIVQLDHHPLTGDELADGEYWFELS